MLVAAVLLRNKLTTVVYNHLTPRAMSINSHGSLSVESGAPGTLNQPSIDNLPTSLVDSPLPVASSTSTSITSQPSSDTVSEAFSRDSPVLSPAQLKQIAGAVATMLCPALSTTNPSATIAPTSITVPVTGSSEGIHELYT